MIDFDDTIIAPATVPGTGAISIIRLSGPNAIALVNSMFSSPTGSLLEVKGGSCVHGYLKDSPDGILDEIVVSVFRAPRSYTGDDVVEISCHASSYVVRRFMELCCKQGARPAEAGEFTRRAFLAGKMDLSQAEAVADIISATSSASHRLALNQLKGGYSAELSSIRSSMLEIAALLELELDFSEEEVEFADREKLRNLVTAAHQRCSALERSFALGNAIKEGVRVVIAGEPNSGKSTLLNAILHEDRAIVSDIAGTTRDSIEETVNIGGVIFRLTDTAGIRQTDDPIESQGVKRTFSLLSKADIVLAMVDSLASPTEIRSFLGELPGKLDLSSQKLGIVVNKIDCNRNVNEINILVTSTISEAIIINISALTGEGVKDLEKFLEESVKSSISSSPSPVLVTNERHRNALRLVCEDLSRLLDALSPASMVPTDLAAQDLRSAIYNLGTITGEVSSDEILGEIFGRFCIGK